MQMDIEAVRSHLLFPSQRKLDDSSSVTIKIAIPILIDQMAQDHGFSLITPIAKVASRSMRDYGYYCMDNRVIGKTYPFLVDSQVSFKAINRQSTKNLLNINWVLGRLGAEGIEKAAELPLPPLPQIFQRHQILFGPWGNT